MKIINSYIMSKLYLYFLCKIMILSYILQAIIKK